VGSIAALDRAKLQNERIGLQNQVRTTLLQAFGGAFLLVTAYITWRQVQVNREGQITERFTRAIEHLGAAEHLDVRLGGIYALERIAHDSHNEHQSIVEILTAFVRGHAPPAGSNGGLAQLPPLRIRAADLQAVMTVLGRRAVLSEDLPVLYLSGLDLRMVGLEDADLRMVDMSATDLSGARLQRAVLSSSNLEKAQLLEADLHQADLRGARLAEADLSGAKLTQTNLQDADLQRANLHGANLSRSTLVRADLRGANLGEARLVGAKLKGATLEGANLWEAELGGADLQGADLTRSILVEANLAGVNLHSVTLDGASLVGAILHGAVLSGATADRATIWPNDFDWTLAGVTVTD
jgi:uncharacterized protein YjbI with pentapeptide repeats